MSKSFTPIKVGKEFPPKKLAKGKSNKYFSDEIISLLMKNKGEVFLVAKRTNIGNSTQVMSMGNSMRNSSKGSVVSFDKKYPNLQLKTAVRQSVDDGGYAELYAKITERKEEK